MNAVEIEAAVSDLAAGPFQPEEFPFQFLAAFDKKETQLKRLRKGDTNKSDVPGGVLLQSNIHMAVCAPGTTHATLEQLKASPKTVTGRAKFILATDGITLEAEDLASGETIAPDYPKFAEHIGFFLPLAGISTVREIKDNPIDVKATGRLNKLYVELLKQNPDWGTEARRHDMNHFMARLIFCFFAEDTGIFRNNLFTSTMEQFTESDGSNTHTVLQTLFRTMNLAPDQRTLDRVPGYASNFPYVNGGLFSDSAETPRFTRLARSFLLQAGSLHWQHINPDIFGSMIQAVADDQERGALGMHYTSVPNILKVLNPLFLDDLRQQLAAAGTGTRALRKLRERLSRIRVFDPACGSGNFLVIAYKQMREIEHGIDTALGETPGRSVIPISNFRGIEIRDFAVEIARLALVIAEYQSNVLYLGQEQAHIIFLPLSQKNWITRENALRVDWTRLWPIEITRVEVVRDDVLQTAIDQPAVHFENEGGEVFICGNPPYKGSKWQDATQKSDLAEAWQSSPSIARNSDYVTGWFARAASYVRMAPSSCAAFVATNSICQGQHASEFWPALFAQDCEIRFARTSFKWNNLASNNAGVTVVVAAIGLKGSAEKILYTDDTARACSIIGPYLIPDRGEYVEKASVPLSGQSPMLFGNMPRDGGHLFLNEREAAELRSDESGSRFVRRFVGSDELINGHDRFCIWIDENDATVAMTLPLVAAKLRAVTAMRLGSRAESTNEFAALPYRFVQIAGVAKLHSIVVPRVSSENRDYLPVNLLDANFIIGDRNFALYDAPLWNMALIASRLHWVWIGTVCVRMRTDFSYSNTLGWNTFPVPPLTDDDKQRLTRCAEDILLAREAHFPATIADLYDPETMPANLRAAHDANDETLEQIYIGRRFKNDTERLEKLFEMYAEMTGKQATPTKRVPQPVLSKVER